MITVLKIELRLEWFGYRGGGGGFVLGVEQKKIVSHDWEGFGIN